MSIMAFSEKTDTIAYGLLSSRVSQVLTKATQTDAPFTPSEQEVLRTGLELLDKFILGSRLVEGDEFKDELIPTPDSITAFQYAMTTLKALEQMRTHETVSKVLVTIRSFLQKVLDSGGGREANSESLSLLRDFFTTLAKLFYTDLVRQRLESSTVRLPGPKIANLYGYPNSSLS